VIHTRVQQVVCLVVVLSMGCAAQAASHLMRMADVHQEQIVFTYEDDLWLVSTEGGDAIRITNDPGSEAWAKFSPDGSQIAFTGQYDGGMDVYVMPARGGVPTRLTYHPSMNRVLGWFPDGKQVLFRTRREYPFRAEMIYKVSTEGGMPVKLNVDRAGLTAISPDGKSIAYNRQSRESRTWKRHQGGTAQDIWVGSLEKADYKRITDWAGSDNFPMWWGDKIYFNSDREFGTLNLYRCNTDGGNVEALTAYKDYDVKYPSLGVDQIVYQYGEELYLLNLKTGATRKVPVNIPSDLVRMRPEFVEVSPSKGSFRLSPTAKRMLLEARGEILNLPVEDGEPINLTRSPGSREKNAAWSPDGKWVAFVSDKTGEEELYLVDQKAEKPWRQLTSGGQGFRMQPVWSPDSKHLIFSDKFLRLNLACAESGAIEVLDQADYDDAWERWGIQDYVWSPDSGWIAYTKMEESMNESIFLYSMEEKKSYRVTDEMTEDWSPSFDPKGRYLYFLSNRTFEPTMGFVDQNHIFLEMCRPYLVILEDGEPSPFVPKDAHEEVEEEEEEGEAEEVEAAEEEDAAEEPAEVEEADDEGEAKKGDKKKGDKKKGDKKKGNKKKGDKKKADEKNGDEENGDEDEDKDKTKIDPVGIDRRIVAAEEVKAGNYFRLEATDKGFCYLKKDDREFEKYQTVTDETGGKLDLYHYDLKKAETKKVLEGIANYHLSADGEKLVYRSGSSYGVVDAGSKAKVGDGKVSLEGVLVEVDRSAEFLQIIDEAWRVQRDWFYDPGMHGVEWEAIRAKYRRFVPDCGNRSDLNYLIGEMIAELNIGHTYVGGGDIERGGKRVSVGLLGADFEAQPGADYYRIKHIIPGTPGDEGERSPLDEPGCPIEEGDYLIAIDGQEVRTDDNVYRLLQNKRSKVVTLTVNDKPSADGAETQRVKTIGSESGIRYREWVEGNKAYVAQKTGGQTGYVHIPNMGESGLIEFARYWFPQYYKKGFVIDARYNGGGFTADMIIDRLEREVWAVTQPREGKRLRDPERVFHGHFVVLINEDTGSNGEFFAEAIKVKKLGPVIGMRTWGGAIGIEPHQDLMDGGGTTPPQFGLYGLDRQWLIEGRGVEPDVEVQNFPGDVVRGRDAQLDAGIERVVKMVAENPKEVPPPPAYPDKSKKK